jgi:hypothetical protein
MKKRSVFLSFLLLFAICLISPKLKVTASDLKSGSEEVIYLTSTQDDIFGNGMHLPSRVSNNVKVKKIVLPKDATYVLSDFRYEMDKALVQNYESLTPKCPNLEEIEVHPENPYFTAVDGILYSKDLKVLYYCPPGKKGAVVLPNEVEVIQYMAFQECSQITSITFSSSLKKIYDGSFGGNSKLTTLKISVDNPNFVVKSNVLFSKDGEILYLYPQGKDSTYYYIPYGVRRIHPGAFMGTMYLETVYLPETVSSIGIEAFRNSSRLTKVKLREGLLEIEAGAFMNCSNLKELTFPEGLLNVYEDAIKGCNRLLSITIPESMQKGPLYLNEVKNRIIKCYSLYEGSWLSYDSVIKNNITAYVYQGTRVADYAKKQGITVKYFTPNIISMSATTKAPSKAVKGTGKPDTSWYNSKKTTFSIKNPDQLAGLATLVNQGKSMSGKTIRLENDLDLSCYANWEPIGKWTETKWRIFKGTFDGQNHIIYNLRMNQVNSYEVGFFGTVQGKIKNLGIQDADVIGNSDVGILCGFALQGTITNCFVSGRVRGNEFVGGMIGRSNSDLTDCRVDVVVKGIRDAGGIVGSNSAIISNCTSMGEVFSYDTAGGISGSHTDSIIDCTNRAIVEGNQNVGGIAGRIDSSGSIKNSSNEGVVTGKDNIGGIAGIDDFTGIIEQSRNEGNVTGRYFVGGIIGKDTIGRTLSCKNYGTVTGISSVGGIVGSRSTNDSKEEDLFDCTNEGIVLSMLSHDEIVGGSKK